MDKSAPEAFVPLRGCLCEHICGVMSALKKFLQTLSGEPAQPPNCAIWNYNAFMRYLEAKETDEQLLSCLIDFLTVGIL
jgi:hypothetical protein